MSKELTPLKAFDNLCGHLDYDTTDYMFNGGYEEDSNIIETALKALKIIKSEILDDLTFDDNKQQITIKWNGVLEPFVTIEEKDKYELLKEILK